VEVEKEEEEHTELEASDFEIRLWHGNPPVAAFARLAAGRRVDPQSHEAASRVQKSSKA
jgi:hypothetical protein